MKKKAALWKARELANDTAICGLQHNCREQRSMQRPAKA